MSLAATALRLAAVEALSPFAQHGAADPVWPTFAGPQVFDSLISPVALPGLVEKLPVIVVSTDAGKVEARGSAPDVTIAGDGKATLTLAFEIMVPVLTRGEQGEAVALVGPTDAMAKAILELIEDQIRQRLIEARMNGALRHVLQAIEEVESQPYTDPDTETPLSATRLELKCHIRQPELWPQAPPAGPFALLPQPLRDVAGALPAGSYGATICLGLADLIGRPALFPALNRMRLAVNLVRGAGDAPAPPADASGTVPTGDVAAAII